MEIGIDRRRLSSLAATLVKSPSINPPAEMGEIAELTARWLSENGLTPEFHEPAEGKISVIARIGSGRPRIILNGHLDVVPIGERARWRFDPFGGRVMRGRLYGRGAADMKSGCAALMEAVASIRRLEDELNGEAVLSLVPDEETGGEYGTRYLLKKGVLKGDVAVIAEPTDAESVMIGEKGMLWLRVSAAGEPGHGSMSGFVGKNALALLLDGVSRIQDLHGKRVVAPLHLREAVRAAGRITAEIAGMPGAAKIPEIVTVNVGVVRGGVKCNIIPDMAEAEIDIRIPLGLKAREIARELKRLLSRSGLGIEVVGASEPNASDPSTRLIKELLSTVKNITKRSIKPALFWVVTDGRHFRREGIPTAVFGPGGWMGVHAYNESVSLRSLYLCAEVYLLFLKNVLLTQKHLYPRGGVA